MTRRFENEHFEHFDDRPGIFSRTGHVYDDLEFLHCKFDNCNISVTRNPRKRTIVRNVHLVDCHLFCCDLWTAAIEEVTVEGLGTHDWLSAAGAVFKHVLVRGSVGTIVSATAGQRFRSEKVQRAFDSANAAYYSKVDWALDISQAEFTEATLKGIPAELIRHNPETQFVVKRENVIDGRWRSLDLSDSVVRTSIEHFIKSETDDVVLVAPQRAKDFRKQLADLETLRREGIAEPD